MEVLQCDGCDFRAQSYEDLKTHIQDVHTAFLQPTDVTDEGSSQDQSVDTNSTNQSEAVFPSLKDEFAPTEETHDQTTPQSTAGSYYSHSPGLYSLSSANSSKPTNKFFQCKFCVRYFRSKYLLVEHTKKVHGSGGGNPGASGNANFNIMLHDGFGKVFSCQFCTYKSPRRARIIKHQKMYHKNSLKEMAASPASQTSSVSMPMQESCKELPAEVVERSILESMVKPLTKSRGNFCCEWCSYQTPRRERWCDHMMKKHRGMVKILSSLRQDGLNISNLQNRSSQMANPGTSYMPLNMATHDTASVSMSPYRGSVNSLPGSNPSKYQSMPYVPIKPKISSNSSLLNLPERSPYGMSEKPNTIIDMDESSYLNDSSSDDDYIDIDGENGMEQGMSGETLLGSENKLLETKGIPFRRFMNRFQCPFCPFLTMHRRSISRHIENIHLSGKTPVYKCDECPFACKSPLKLGAHKQCHGGGSSEWDPMSSLNESMSSSLNESYDGNNINGRKSGNITDSPPQNPYKCTLCNYSTTTLKGLRVHQQHKHSFCDNLPNSSGNLVQQMQGEEIDLNDSGTVKKSQTSILGLSSKNNFVAKGAKKGANEFPLDLSPVKKRTRIDEIASNLQSKINQSKQQEDSVINVEDDEEEEENEVEIEVELDKEEEPSEQETVGDQYPLQTMWNRDMINAQKNTTFRNVQNNYSVNNGAEIELTLSDDDEEYYYQSSGVGEQDQNSSVLCNQANLYESDQIGENAEFNEESGRLYYCKHCDFSNKSARSVSTHYQRMHPYVKFSFRYILDPNDHSAVYRCLECYIDFNKFEDLHQHYSEHHPDAMNVLNFNQSDLIYRCRFCSYTSPNVRSLMPHYQRMHPTVKINNAMIFSSYVVDRTEDLNSESQTLREILNSAPKNMVTSTPSSHGNSSAASFNKTPTSNPKSFSTDNDNEKSSSVNNVVVYDCDICGFASPNMHSVLVHSQKKHPEEKASYYRIQKTMRVVSVDSGTAISQLAFDGGASVTPSISSVASQPETNVELYYCKHCSYSNRSVVGVLVHYQKRHPEIKVTAKYIRQVPPTSESLRNNGGQHNLAERFTGPLHSTKKGVGQPKENEMFFCQHCDYGNQTVKGVLIHYQKKHKDYKTNADAVRQHTAVIRSLCEQGQKKATTIQNPPSTTEPEKTRLRSIKCRQCSFSTPYVYALRKHMKKDHPHLKATVTSIIKWAFLDGFIEAGYHCEWCIYSHPDPSGLLEHYQRRHPEHYVDYTYMATKLCAGPEASPSQLTPENKSYKCRDCNFEASSIWDITNHYQSFHPWALKGDESVLLDIIKDNDTIQKTHTIENTLSHISSVQKAYRPMESGDDSRQLQHKPSQMSSSLLSSPYQCTVCLSEYNNLHGLLTHYGKKHPGMKVKAADFAQDVDINRGAVYKCRHCPYINTRIHGVLTHYQKRHPLIKVTAEDFVHDVERSFETSQNESEENRIFKQGYGAYSCKLCPYTHGSLEKLKVHYEKYHHQAEPDMLAKSSEQEIPCSTTDVPSDYNPPQTIVTLEPGEVAEITGFRPRKNINPHAIFRCQLCKYYCSTRKGIARHYRIKHNNVRAQPEGQNNLFKCALCSYTNPIRKGLAAHYQKRHDIDAYYTHCLAASRSSDEELSKAEISTPFKEEPSEMTDDLKKAIELKTCSLCSFQSYSKKGIVSHYIKRHPGVFPKKQHVSKLGAYFTLVYGEKNETPCPLEEKPELDAPSEDSETQEQELLPFRCIKCFKLSFSTADLLCMHYTDHHSKDLKRDFAILGTTGTRSYTTTYQCKHCSVKLVSISELTIHLNSHIEEFQKRAKRQERRKQLLQKQKSAENAVQDCKQEKTGVGQETMKKTLMEKVVVGYKCKFCVEVHPTLRAIVNHLRKHIGHGNAPPLPPEVKEDADTSNTEVSMDVTKLKTENDSAEASKPEPVVEGEEEPSKLMKKEQKLPKRCRVGGYPCKQCDRVLMSMQGLRSHERSHLALAMFTREDKYSCQFCSFVSAFRHNLDRHLQEHHGHHKPFKCKHCPFKACSNSRLKMHFAKAHASEHAYKCSFCSISKMTISQLKDHCIKAHGKSLTLPKVRSMAPSSPRSKNDHEPQMEKEGPEEPLYSEPPDVQQQLNHYQSAALARNNSNNSPIPLPLVKMPSEPKEDSILKCEFCDFSSGYIQSIRRHYRDKHGGKKLFKCKECSFYTCFKSAFTMHVEAGHSSVPQEGPKDLRCPLCLYHTKFKHNMIDHIVLHREERVVPIEVCRSKLSKQLQGVVFRCDKCTFTCSSDENLQQHIVKHNELRPYKCQLCYYETKQNEELDSHLREEHKVCRNFELVGLVNLDQLEQMKDKTEPSSSDEEEASVKSEVKEEVPDIKVVTQEKRFPCEFCGRTFALQAEWEKHVLRHGMTSHGNKKENEENKKLEENVENLNNDIKHAEDTTDTSQQTKPSCLKILAVTKNE